MKLAALAEEEGAEMPEPLLPSLPADVSPSPVNPATVYQVDSEVQFNLNGRDVVPPPVSPPVNPPASPVTQATGYRVGKEVPLNPNCQVFQPAMNNTVAEQNHNVELINAIRLPATQLVSFDGDPLKFWTFMRSFENAVESCTNDDAAKLMRLINFCSGKARKVIEYCAVMQPSEGFARAKALLKQRFGNDYLIAEAWIRKVTSGKPIGPNDRERLQDLADNLSSCIETLSLSSHIGELNNQSTLLKIAELLPWYLQARVKREICKARDAGIPPNICDLARLIREAANEVNDSVFGKLAMQADKVTTPRVHISHHSTSAATSATEEHTWQDRQQSSGTGECQQTNRCLMCNNWHTLFGCQQFKQLSVDEQIGFAKRNRLFQLLVTKSPLVYLSIN